jgi:Fe-S oxidoreductase
MDSKYDIQIPVMADLVAKDQYPEYLLWIGCAGAFDERYKKVIQSLIKVLNLTGIDFAVLGPEESCTGDPARRAGNELLFQMQALSNIQLMNGYHVKKILTACPHCYNTFKNEYPDLGGHYEVIHHSELIDQILKGKGNNLQFNSIFSGKKVTYHDSCYLGRSNNIYESPRNILYAIQADLKEMGRHHANALCCGAGGSQMFKDAEEGQKEINIERTEEAMNTGSDIIATACPFCLTMISDGLKAIDKEEQVEVLDIVELFQRASNP